MIEAEEVDQDEEVEDSEETEEVASDDLADFPNTFP